MSLIATKTNFSKSGNIGAQRGIATKILKAESVVTAGRSGREISQDPTWFLDNTASLRLSPGAGGHAVTSSRAAIYARGVTQALLFPLAALSSFWEK